MDRRKFLGLMVGGIAAPLVVRTWPFRVFSFPSRLFSVDWAFASSSNGALHIFDHRGIRLDSIALQLESVRQQIPILYEKQDTLHKFLNESRDAWIRNPPQEKALDWKFGGTREFTTSDLLRIAKEYDGTEARIIIPV